MPFTAEDDRRLATWAIDVVAALLPNISCKDEGENRRWAGGLSVHRGTGQWYSFAESRGGHSALRLIRFLRPQYDRAQAATWAVAFLKQHAGTGSCTDDYADDEITQLASKADAEQVLADALPDIAGTLAETYLHSRGIALPVWPPGLQFLETARAGEAGLVAHLTSHDRTVGVEVTYLDPTGKRSLCQPVRRRFMLERVQDAVFELPGTQGVIITEGIVDALSLRMAGVTSTILGIPGIGTLQHLNLQAREVVVFRDGDAPGSAADKGLIKGVDHLLLQDIAVRVTTTPKGADANALLTTVGHEVLLRLLEEAEPAGLSIDGEVVRLSLLGVVDYDQQRTEVSKKLGVRVGTLDQLVKRARPKEAKENTDLPEDEPWDGEVILREVLDEALVQLRRYIVAPDHTLATAVLWCAHTHLVHNEAVSLQRSPRLAIQSRTSGCGKTTAIEIIACLSCRGKTSSSLTASTLLRTMGSERGKRTYCIDEADRAFSDRNSDLIAILDCGDRRASAVVDRSVPTEDGGWEPREFNVWGAVAFSGIDELPSTLQDRSIRLFLEKATSDEIPEHLRDGASVELVTLRRQLTAWGAGLLELSDPVMPDYLMRQAGRVGDRWRPLLAVAESAGGQWPELSLQAVQAEIAAETRRTLLERLLASIQAAFDAAAADQGAAENQDRLTTPTLVSALVNDRDEEWDTIRQGRPLDAYFLRDRLRGLLHPSGAANWWTGPAERRVHHSGYSRTQFEEAWRRYLPRQAAPDAPSAPDATTDQVPHRVQKKPRKSAKKSPDAPDAPDAPDHSGSIRVDGGVSGNGVDPLAEAAIELRAQNPSKSLRWLAAQLGQPEEHVRQALGERS